MKAISFVAAATLLVAIVPAAQAQGFAVGSCVAVQGGPAAGRIVRATPGGYVVLGAGQSDPMNWSAGRVTAGPCPPGGGGNQPKACPRSDADSLGASDLERRFRGAVRQTIEHPASVGADGAVTVTFQSFQIGAARAWTPLDARNFSADQSKPVYPLRVKFTSCTDFVSAIEVRQQEENYECFIQPTGQLACQMSGHSGNLMQPTRQRFPK
jgi:hypothetical protein